MKLVQLNEDLANLSDELKDKVVVALDDTQAQVALETEDKKEEVKKDTKPAVDASNDIAKKTNADGKAKEIFESVGVNKRESEWSRQYDVGGENNFEVYADLDDKNFEVKRWSNDYKSRDEIEDDIKNLKSVLDIVDELSKGGFNLRNQDRMKH